MTQETITYETDFENAPKDRDLVFTGVVVETLRWLPYKSTSQQFKRGIQGRWQKYNGYGWDNCDVSKLTGWAA